MIDFHQTVMGHKFFEGTMPALVEALNRIAAATTALVRQNEQAAAKEEKPEYPRLDIAGYMVGVRKLLPHLEYVSRKAILRDLAALLEEYCPKCGHTRRGTGQDNGCRCDVPKVTTLVKCKKCGSPLQYSLCTDETCPYHNKLQDYQL